MTKESIFCYYSRYLVQEVLLVLGPELFSERRGFLGWSVRALMSGPTHNDPAVSRRVTLLLIITTFFILGVNARSSYAYEPRFGSGGLQSGILANYDIPGVSVPTPKPPFPLSREAKAGAKFPPLKMPIPAGPGYIPADGGYTNALLHIYGTYDQYALDICEGSSCFGSGSHAVAPTDITFEYSSPYANGYHFFEIYDDGQEKLCMSLGHFDWSPSVFPSGAPEPGTEFPQGAVLGELNQWERIPHVHIGIWKMATASPYGYPVKCHYWSVYRQPLAFTGQYAIDGQEFPACWPRSFSCYNTHAGRPVESSNAAFSFVPVSRPLRFAGMFYEKDIDVDIGKRITPAKTGDPVARPRS